MNNQTVLSVVIPCFNEEGVIEPLLASLLPVLRATEVSYEIIFVNDGSDDQTLAELLAAQSQYKEIKVVDLSRNFGKDPALSAGLEYASGQAIIPMDADLQDPPELIPAMLEKWRDGFDVVLMKRQDRSQDSWLKRFSAERFYALHNYFAHPKIPENVGDFRLLDRKVIDVVCQLPERQRFMKGLLAWPGFTSTTIEYARAERAAGHTKWNYWRLWNFALDGITAFSTFPLRLWTYVGLLISMGTFIYGVYIVVNTVVYGVETPGFASLAVLISMLGGIQLISIGVIGEYIARIHTEVKKRPLFVVQKAYGLAPYKSVNESAEED